MFIINTTYSLSPTEENNFLNWLKLTHLPQIIHENNLREVKILKIALENQDEVISYCVQLHSETQEDIAILKEKEAKYKHLLFKEFAQEVVSFSTELHLVEEYNLYAHGTTS